MDRFANAIAEADRNDTIDTDPGDIWILVDKADGHGYGDGDFRHTVNLENYSNARIRTGRALALEEIFAADDPNKNTKTIVKHNIGHCFVVLHNAGHYQHSTWNGINDVSNMSRGYVRVKNGDDGYDADTRWTGNGDVPDNFENVANWVDKSYCGGIPSGCRHSVQYSDRAITVVEKNTPIPAFE